VTRKNDQPVVYACRLLNRVEHNYSATKKDVLTMVFTLHKFKHYLLGNKFVFYVDHMALVYLVNKPQVSGIIASWLLLFLEYDFTIMYKPGKTHVVIDVLSRLLDASLFYIELELLKDVKEFLKRRQIEGMLSIQQK